MTCGFRKFISTMILTITIVVLNTNAISAVCVGGNGVAWDNATPGSNQTINSTEVLADGQIVATVPVPGDQVLCEDISLAAGDYAFTARHVGTADGQPSTSAEAGPVTLTIAQVAGVPEVAPPLRFLGMADRTTARG